MHPQMRPAPAARQAGHVEVLTPLKQHNFVDAFYELSSESHFWYRWRFEALMRQLRSLELPQNAPWRVLDVGSGKGVLRDQLMKGTDWTVDITDLHYDALTQARPSRGRTLYYDILERKTELKESYDAVIIFDVLEHIESTPEFIDALLFHLKKGGLLLVNVPALMSLYSRFDEIQGHFRRYRKSTLASEFDPFDLEIKDLRYWGLSNVPLLWLRRAWLNFFGSGKSDDEVFRAGFTPPMKLANSLFLSLMKAELALLPKPPAGTSVLLAAKKK